MPPKLWKYYLSATLIPLVANVLATGGWLVYEHRWGSFSQIPRDMLAGENLDLILISLAVGNGLTIAALSTPIFLNASPTIRNKPWLSWVSWSLLPLLWLLYIATYVDIDGADIIQLLLSMTLPYLLINPWIFFSYRRALRTSTPLAEDAANTGSATPLID